MKRHNTPYFMTENSVCWIAHKTFLNAIVAWCKISLEILFTITNTAIHSPFYHNSRSHLLSWFWAFFKALQTFQIGYETCCCISRETFLSTKKAHSNWTRLCWFTPLPLHLIPGMHNGSILNPLAGKFHKDTLKA